MELDMGIPVYRSVNNKWETTRDNSTGGHTSNMYEELHDWYDQVTVDQKNPRWRSQVKRHVSASTSFTAERLNLKVGHTRFEFEWGPTEPYNVDKCFGQIFCPDFPDTTSMPSAAQRLSVTQVASMKLLLKARRAQTELQSLVSLGEFGQTLRMLRNPAKSLFRGIGDYLNTARRRARKEKTRKRKERVLQATWLEYSFGWVPLASDIEGAYKALTKMPEKNYRKVRSGAEDTYKADPDTGTSTVYRGVFRWNQVVSYKVSCKAYGEVGVSVTRPGGQLANWGLRTSEFLPTLWELIPYSFVVDYFSNVGSAIAAATFPESELTWSGSTTRSSVTKSRAYTWSEQGTDNNVTSYKGGSGITSPSSASRTRIHRASAIIAGWSAVKLTFQIPGLNLQWLNLGALLTQHRRSVSSLR